MRLINNYRDWYKLWSVWLFALVGVYQWLEANWAVLDTLIPDQWRGVAGIVLSVLGVVSRLVVQSNLKKE